MIRKDLGQLGLRVYICRPNRYRPRAQARIQGGGKGAFPPPPPHKKLLPQIVRRGSMGAKRALPPPRGAKRALAPPYKILDPPMGL